MRETVKQKPTIGVLAGIQVYYGTILGNFIGPLLHGVCSAAENRGCNLLLAGGMGSSPSAAAHPAWPIPAPEADFIPVGHWNADGLIVVNPLFSESQSQYVRELIAANYPVVFVTTGETGPTVAIDNIGTIRQALLHFKDHGHRKIAFIAGYPNDVAGDSGVRLNAFHRIVQEYGLSADPRLIAYGNHGIPGGQQAMRQILDAGVPFTAVLASNDESAIGAMRMLKSAGLRIPQDVAIIGIDDTFDAMAQVPPLTTFHISPFRLGYQALELLLDYIEGRVNKLDSITIPVQFAIRQSCGCPPNAMSHVVISDAGESAFGGNTPAIPSGLAKAMAEIVLSGTQRLNSEEVYFQCRHLVEAFFKSLRMKDPLSFHSSVEETLTRVEALEDDTFIWYDALSALDGSLRIIQKALGWSPTDRQPEKMIAEARAIIAQHAQRQYRHLAIHQRWIADQIGQLNARLLTALDEAQVYEILANFLPQVFIQDIGVAFFEAGNNDPVTWSRLRKVLNHNMELRFPSRQFPPEDLYAEPYRLVLLPMVSREKTPGFVVFDAADLEICAHIVRQLVIFLKVVRLYQEATQGRRLAEEANRLNSRFLSTVSHELRTPLNLIVGLSEMLLHKGKKNGSELEQDLKRIHASAQHLDGLIRDVLDLAQNEMGELRLVCAPLDLTEALEVVATVGEQLVQDKGLEWRASIPRRLPEVWGDRTRIRQVALNLINNAVKFTHRGRVTLQVSATNEMVTVEVSDTGLGIPPSDQAIVFDEFRQSERTTTLGYGGLGLGLAICKRLVELHGGSIGVRSSGEEGAGSTFYFNLPVMKSKTELDLPEMISHDRIVLLIAERPGNGEQLREYLIGRGFSVEMVWIDARNTWMPLWLSSQPGAIILEQGTDTEQGWEVMKALRENSLTQKIPVLFYSLDGKQGRGSVLELDYLTKPLNKTELSQVLEHRGVSKGTSEREKSILIVDDEPSTLELHARMVTARSPACRILKARNGKEALEVIHEAGPDLVLLDLVMPELDGFGVLEAMRSDQRSRDIPVIVLTGQTLTLEDMEKLGRGVTSVLRKGLFSTEETLAHIEAALVHSTTLGSEAQRIVRKAMVYLHEHYMESISLEDAARHVSISKEYLARCFRQEMGITLVTYLNRYRVRQAKVLLDKGGRNLTEIALETGFSSSAYFSRVFRKEVGISPREYIRTTNP
jgi:signal transduction histidine kinase/DNA-binding LacI/PurR family transcriptional regulator/DNA-binding response OmpR family regulator